MPAISAYIISFNEEAKIEACLARLKGLVDEIVLVDSGSTDRTLELAEPYADVIIEHPFEGYLEQKNYAISQTRHDWVLNVDSDEQVSEELAASLRAFRESEPQHAAFEFTRKSFYVYRWLEHTWYPEFRVRLFDKRKGYHGGTNPHEKVLLKEGTIGVLKGDLYHYSFDSVTDHIDMLQRFTTIGARELLAKGKSFNLLTPVTHSAWTFFKLYLLRLGFLDGFAGLCVAVLMASHVFTKYAKVLTWRFQEQRGLPTKGLD
jgi:hypothetical protein